MIEESDRIKKISEYFFSIKMKEIRDLEKQGIKIINLGIGNPDLPPPSGVINKMKKASELNCANSYQISIGIDELRNSISNWYKNIYDVIIDPNEEILPLIGSKEGIMHISMCYLNKGDEVLIPNPGYPTYSSISKLLGANIIYYNLYEKNNWLPNLKVLDSMNLTKVKIMWINYPHMPTGANIDLKKLEEIISLAIKNNILLVYDNPYSCITEKYYNFLSIFNAKNSRKIALELNSLSKNYNMPGWRVGMVIGNKNFIRNILKVKSQMDSGMYYPIQMGAIEAMKNNKTKDWFIILHKEYTKRRKIIWEICDLLNIRYSKKNNSGIFVWAKLNNNDNDIMWSEKILKKYNIFITPGRVFGNNGKGYVRISICCPINILIEAKNRISL
ncbi:pyridoxal phosphate-dependent aminotransferase [Blattabacterium cuenoti]|uniref:pyridoxal phosphate-dependent aminotransferase n=1 Tax=Blattabacterium cuenoti TaxID=1653831 RepID=UPI00163D279D|nr:aminotransferase class I/II-fold pyridoxal phosphate-dependent enzyme [Blattabacterium cuenoti]